MASESPTGLPAADTVVVALGELAFVEHRLEVLYQRLLLVPIPRDSLDPAILAIEHLLEEVGSAQHRVASARITAEIRCRKIGRLPKQREATS